MSFLKKLNRLYTNLRFHPVLNESVTVLRDKKGNDAAGGSSTTGSFLVRDLNEQLGDTSFCTLNGDSTFTLKKGVYDITGSVPSFRSGANVMVLYDETNTAILHHGTQDFSNTASAYGGIRNNVNVVITLLTTTKLALRARSNDAKSGDGLGYGNICFGDASIFSQVSIRKLK